MLLAEAGQSGDRAAEGREQGGSTESTVGKEGGRARLHRQQNAALA